MTLTNEEVEALIGRQVLEIYLLKKQIAALQEQVKKLSEAEDAAR